MSVHVMRTDAGGLIVVGCVLSLYGLAIRAISTRAPSNTGDRRLTAFRKSSKRIGPAFAWLGVIVLAVGVLWLGATYL